MVRDAPHRDDRDRHFRRDASADRNRDRDSYRRRSRSREDRRGGNRDVRGQFAGSYRGRNNRYLTNKQRHYDDRGHGRNNDRYVPNEWRERSRDGDRERLRKRSRDRSGVRDLRDRRYRDDRSGDRGYRGGRDRFDDRDPKRPRRDESRRRSQTRDGSRNGRSSRNVKDGESPALTSAEKEEREKELKRKGALERTAKWKAEKLAEKAAKDGTTLNREATNDPDTKTTTSPSANSPAAVSEKADSPAVKGDWAEDTTGPWVEGAKRDSPLPFKRKFDPAAIRRNVERKKAMMGLSAVGADVMIPKSMAAQSIVNGAKLADNSKVAPSGVPSGTSHSSPTPGSKISGFGLSKAATDKEKAEKATQRSGLELEDEEEAQKMTLEKLPSPPSDEVTSGDASHANGADGHDTGDDDFDEADDDQEDKVAAAARAAAEKRAQGAQANVEQNDTLMADTAEEVKPTHIGDADAEMKDEGEEIDPLDEFMGSLEFEGVKATTAYSGRRPASASKPAANAGKPAARAGKAAGDADKPARDAGKAARPKVYDSDEEGVDLDAVGDDTGDFLAMMKQRKKIKEIPTVNHANIEYEPFRKSFYSEPIELADMDEEQVRLLRFELDDIKIRGSDAPKPVLKWSQLALNTQTLDIIKSLKFETLTAIQSQAVPAIMSGRDVIGVAKTGSGKTVAFLLPMFRHIKDQRELENLEGPIGLIMAPTRELATQIHRECKPYLKALNLRALCAYGGAPIKDQISELKRGAEVVVCTPGRMIDLLAANSGRVTNLRRVTYIVLDEADRMFDMGFEPQINKILQNIRPDRQTVLFSATFPQKMEGLARKALTDPVEIIVGGRSVVAKEITQVIEVRSESSKSRRMLALLDNLYKDDEEARALIFVERQETADILMKELLEHSYPCVSIHGGRDQVDRDQCIEDFKAGAVPIMTATSVAARGLDVKQLKLVINYDCPNHMEDYVHRAGRTGRAGNSGTAVTFITPEQERFAKFLVKALTRSSQEAPKELLALEMSFKKKIERGETVNAGSGFTGKGLEIYDVKHDTEKRRERVAGKGRERSLLKPGEDNEDEDRIEGGETKDTSAVDELLAKATGQIRAADATPEPARSLLPSALARHLDAAMTVQKSERPGVVQLPNPAMDAAMEVIAKINARLGAKGATRSGIPIDNKGPDAGAFHTTLEINDFPQKARWAVTNRTNVAKILDQTGTSITSKGNYYPPGKEPEPGHPMKLYILVEGDTEKVVKDAMNELVRLLREGAIAAFEAEGRAPVGGGRYSVV